MQDTLQDLGKKAHKRTTVTITPRQLSVFQFLRKNKFEIGGFLDFEAKRNIESFLSYFGSKTFVDIPDLDYEIDFHTHPDYDDGRVFNPPSPSDLLSLLQQTIDIGTQGSLVFTEEGVYIIAPSDDLIDKYQQMSKSERKSFDARVTDSVEYAFEEANDANDASVKSSYWEVIKKIGWRMRLHAYGKTLRLHIYT
jgi:hypothetical protein